MDSFRSGGRCLDWVRRMTMAIDYIEENLCGELSIDDAAREAFSSRYHFHRMFYAMVGVTPAEYIRRRKLTMAAAELAGGQGRVVDIAARYGYDSPNAFTRAFRNLHGINPGKVRAGQVLLSTYNRISLNSKSSGTAMLEYKIVEKPEFRVLGKSQEFSFEKFVAEGPEFWKQYVGSDEYKSLLTLNMGLGGEVTQAPLLSVYFPDEQGRRQTFTDVLGIESLSEVTSDEFSTHIVPTATYAEFSCTYQSSMKTNKYIYGEWFTATGYQRDGSKPDVLAYFPLPFRPMKEMLLRWWIPVVKKV